MRTGGLSFENGRQLLVPKGFAHGFATRTAETEIIYKCSDYYHRESEDALAWDDPEIGIDWNLAGQSPVLSARDRAAGRLAELESPFRYEW